VDLVETTDADDEHELRLGLDVVTTLGLGSPLQLDQALVLHAQAGRATA